MWVCNISWHSADRAVHTPALSLIRYTVKQRDSDSVHQICGRVHASYNTEALGYNDPYRNDLGTTCAVRSLKTVISSSKP